MTLLFTMTIAGSLPVLLCLLFCLFCRNSFDAIHGIWLLRIGIFFYLVPVQLLYHVLPAPIVSVTPRFSFPKDPQILIDFSYKLQIPFHGKLLLIPYWLLGILAVGCAFSLLLFIQQSRKYRQFRQSYRPKKSTPAEEALYTEVSTPFTLGILHPHIFMPAQQKDIAGNSYIYQHELYHVQHHDTLWKILCMLVLGLHWCNPFAWCLVFLYDFVSECASDQNVTQTLTDDKRRIYANMLIQYAAPKGPQSILWQNNFSHSRHLLKRRLTLIMKRSYQKKAIHTLLLSIALFVSVIFGSATVWAYSPLEVTGFMSKPDYTFTRLYLDNPDGTSPFALPADTMEFHGMTEVILNEDGTTSPLSPTNIEMKIVCNHTYAVKTTYSHKKNTTGGCVLKTYHVMCCTSCQAIKSRKLIDTNTYTTCHHK